MRDINPSNITKMLLFGCIIYVFGRVLDPIEVGTFGLHLLLMLFGLSFSYDIFLRKDKTQSSEDKKNG